MSLEKGGQKRKRKEEEEEEDYEQERGNKKSKKKESTLSLLGGVWDPAEETSDEDYIDSSDEDDDEGNSSEDDSEVDSEEEIDAIAEREEREVGTALRNVEKRKSSLETLLAMGFDEQVIETMLDIYHDDFDMVLTQLLSLQQT